MVALIGCTEIYKPIIDPASEALVVEGMITDGAGPFTIKLSNALLFSSDSISSSNYVSGAKMTVADNENNSFALTEREGGMYTLPSSFKAKIGDTYKLHIETNDGNIYESNPEELLPPQTYDSIRGIYTNEEYIGPKNVLEKVEGADIQVDLFKSVSNLNYIPSCRFSSDITIQYLYTESIPDTISWHWFYFGWSTYKLEGNENITNENLLTTNAFIKNHSIGFIPYQTTSYGIETAPYPTVIYYLRMNQYTLNKDTYLFYKAANNQLAATGKLFDPITSQLYGNMKCVNNPSKVILGLFEVSSVTQPSFLVTKIASNNTVVITRVPLIDVPPAQVFRYRVWQKWPTPIPKEDSLKYYIPIPLPGWWYHN